MKVSKINLPISRTSAFYTRYLRLKKAKEKKKSKKERKKEKEKRGKRKKKKRNGNDNQKLIPVAAVCFRLKLLNS